MQKRTLRPKYISVAEWKGSALASGGQQFGGQVMRAVDETEWRAVQALFEELVDLAPDEQTRRLTKSKHPKHVVRQAAALLTASRSEGILDMAAPSMTDPLAAATTYTSLAQGQEVGGFTIKKLIGRGGMGEVYLARRTSADFDQLVALKLLRAEAADRGDAFLRERRLLARLEHPGISRLIDAGIAPDGRPYMAMEYIEGQSIDVYCRDHKCSLEQRLNLFRDVCDAVSYAHAKLIVHRDIKPSNIMIDNDGKVRLLDFGIAKLLDDTSLVPATTQAMLTPDYAAPEQLDGDEPTVAADVYALGIVLYELVCGKGPWRRDGASVPAIIRRVLYEDPALPSKAAADAGAPVAASQIAGDLDAIIMKAMRRNPAERYRSVADLATDVQRHQELKPVQARDGSTRYMVGRFVRRYRWAVAASTAAIVALLIGAGGIAWQARQTAIERDVALAEARRSEAINRMLTLMLSDTAASDAGGDATVKQMLDQTASKLVDTLDTSPKSADLIVTLFDLYVNLEDSAGADALIQKALVREIGKGNAVATALLKMRAATSAAALGRTDDMAPLLDAAEPVFRADPERFRYELVDLAQARAQLLRRTGKVDDAIKLLVQTLPDADIAYAEKDRDLLTLYNNLLVYMSEANQMDAMPAIFDRADAVIKRTGQDNSMQGLTIRQLRAVRLTKLGQPAAAEKIITDIVAKRRAAFGSSAGLAVDLLQLGRAKLALGKFNEAQQVFGEAYPMAEKYLSPAAPPTLILGTGLLEAQAEAGNLNAAQRTLAQVEPLVAAIPKPGLPQAIFAKAKAVLLLKQGKPAQAKAETEKAEQLFKEQGPAGDSYLRTFPALRARLAKT
jgi:eukaryotic-like serine/threonine-protein kinase